MAAITATENTMAIMEKRQNRENVDWIEEGCEKSGKENDYKYS